MKRIAGLVCFTLFLWGAVLLLRSLKKSDGHHTSSPPPAASRPAPRVPVRVNLTTEEAAPLKKTAAKPRELLASLSRAISGGDRKAILEIMEQLREILLTPVPNDQNSAILYETAFAILPVLTPKAPATRKLFSDFAEGKTLGPQDLALLREWRDANREPISQVLKLVREASDRPECRFSPNIEMGIGADLSLVNIENTVKLLAAETSFARLDNKPEEAAENLRAIIALGQAARSDPTLMSQNLAENINNSVFEALQKVESLAAPRVASLLEKVPLFSARASFERTLMGMAYEAAGFYLQSDSSKAPAFGRVVSTEVEAYSDVLGLMTRPLGDIQTDLDSLVLKHASPALADSEEISSLYAMLKESVNNVACSDARSSILRTAVDLERYRAREGSYPETLGALGPVTPLDPWTGQPLIYRREGNHFFLDVAAQVPGAEKLSWKSRN